MALGGRFEILRTGRTRKSELKGDQNRLSKMSSLSLRGGIGAGAKKNRDQPFLFPVISVIVSFRTRVNAV